MILMRWNLTHWGWVTHICVGKLTITGPDNGLSPGRRQAIIWNNAGILSIGLLGTNFSEILIEIQIFSFKKMRLKVSSAKWRPFCLGLNVWIHIIKIQSSTYFPMPPAANLGQSILPCECASHVLRRISTTHFESRNKGRKVQKHHHENHVLVRHNIYIYYMLYIIYSSIVLWDNLIFSPIDQYETWQIVPGYMKLYLFRYFLPQWNSTWHFYAYKSHGMSLPLLVEI